MPEKCANDPTQTCRSATRLVLLDKVVEYQEAQQAKPERLLDKLKENSFWLVLAAVLGAVLARVGL